MGNINTCFGCCPPEEIEDGHDYDETSPLLRDNAHPPPAHMNGGTPGGARGVYTADQTAPPGGSYHNPGGSTHAYGSQVADGHAHPIEPPLSAEQARLAEIFSQTAHQIMDCSEAAHVSRKEVKMGGTRGVASNEEGQRELATRAVEYGQRLSTVASTLARQHLSAPPVEVALAESGELALGESPEAILTDSDQVLLNEVASRAQESLHDLKVPGANAVVVAFGGKRDHTALA
ncbi:uncharacterized protein LOC131884130 [Tigriopus californicus]|uniref:uncharacterized protein LOC131884130 n=1 Tax=Tigriopus californicus TaxID=6832 RepID=UPI0027DA57C8|nr:uncharacterized protein LOC131884130 [Tigriopus californicus]